MRMPEVLLLSLLVTALPALATEIPETAPDIIGEAVDMDSGELLYRELHYCIEPSGACSVYYEDTQGALIALKQLDYSANPQAPDLKLIDFNAQRTVAKTSQDYGENYVVDAGFDNFVRLQWDRFSDGQAVEFPLLVANRDSALNMRAKTPSNTDCADTELCLRVELDSWLLSKIVPAIQLTYAADSQRLLRYRGISNLKVGDGGNPVVDIRYTYQQREPSGPELAQCPDNATNAAVDSANQDSHSAHQSAMHARNLSQCAPPGQAPG